MKKIILKLIVFYQKTLSPDHGFIFSLSGNLMCCRFFHLVHSIPTKQ